MTFSPSSKTSQSTVSTLHMGMDGYVWWTGVVESRMDPLHLGRAQVRIHAWHTEDKSLMPTDDLPWAHVVHPINGTHGSVIPPKEGTVVTGFFLDGREGQYPVMTGILHGVPEAVPPADKGFSDPGKDVDSRPFLPGQKPTRYPAITNEPHTPRLARNENVSGANTYIESRTSNAVSVTTASGGKWTEPKPPYAAKYPYNSVDVTESGHVSEFDDTPGAERIHTMHRSGTYEELQPDGSRSVHVYGSDYHIVIKDNNCYIKGSLNINVVGDATISVGGDVTAKITGGVDAEIGKDLKLKVGGAIKIDGDKTFDQTSGGKMSWSGPKYTFV